MNVNISNYYLLNLLGIIIRKFILKFIIFKDIFNKLIKIFKYYYLSFYHENLLF